MLEGLEPNVETNSYTGYSYRFLKEELAEEEYNSLGHWMRGQTGALHEEEGPTVYEWDFKKWRRYYLQGKVAPILD